MAVETVHGETDELGVESLELGGAGGEGHELGGADRGEIGWMAEENLPFALEILGETDLALSGYGLESGGLVAYAGHRIKLLLVLGLDVVAVVHNY